MGDSSSRAKNSQHSVVLVSVYSFLISLSSSLQVMRPSNSIVVFILTILISMTEVSSQGIVTELASVLGLLPTSQILLAGGGLLGLKVMILGRFMKLVGLLSDHHQNRLSDVSDVFPINNMTTSSTESSVTQPPSRRYFGLPNFIHSITSGQSREGKSRGNGTQAHGWDSSQGLPEKNSSTKTTTNTAGNATDSQELTDTSKEMKTSRNDSLSRHEKVANNTEDLPGLIFEDGAAFFPIPGLKIAFDNQTKKNVLVFDHSFQPTFLIPAIDSVDEETGVSQSEVSDGLIPSVNDTSRKTSKDLEVKEDHGKPPTLFFPLKPVLVKMDDEFEEGFSSMINGSYVMVKLDNGSFVPIDSVEDKDHRRNRRQVEHGLSLFFDFVHSLDENDCFAKIVCEVGAETGEAAERKPSKNGSKHPSFFGDDAAQVSKFFSSLKLSNFDPTSHSYHYISHFYFGRTHGFDSCSRGSLCNFDFASLISSFRTQPYLP